MIVRQAMSSDIAQLLEFEQGVIDAERKFASNLKEGPQHYYDLNELITSAESVIMVAEETGVLCASGYARIEKNKPYLNPDRYVYLGFMYVEPRFRGQGVVQQLIDSLIEWSEGQGIFAYKLDVYSQNGAAIRAYERLGFKTEMQQMLRFDRE